MPVGLMDLEEEDGHPRDKNCASCHVIWGVRGSESHKLDPYLEDLANLGKSQFQNTSKKIFIAFFGS